MNLNATKPGYFGQMKASFYKKPVTRLCPSSKVVTKPTKIRFDTFAAKLEHKCPTHEKDGTRS